MVGAGVGAVDGQLSQATGQLSLTVPNPQRLEIFLATQSQSLSLSLLYLNFGSSWQGAGVGAGVGAVVGQVPQVTGQLFLAAKNFPHR